MTPVQLRAALAAVERQRMDLDHQQPRQLTESWEAEARLWAHVPDMLADLDRDWQDLVLAAALAAQAHAEERARYWRGRAVDR